MDKTRLKWTEVDENGLNRMKWTEVDRMDQSVTLIRSVVTIKVKL